MHRRVPLTGPFYANCFIVACLLLIRGHLIGLWLKPPKHLMGVTRQNNIIHFKAEKDDLPWYRMMLFKGRIEVIRGTNALKRAWRIFGDKR
jgi:hypothetical protein